MASKTDSVPLSILRKSPSGRGYSQLSSDAGSSDLDDGGETETQIQEAQNQKETKSQKTDESKQLKEEKKDGTSSLAVMMHILRTFVGTGILALPYAFKNFGLISGLVGTFVVWCFMTYSLYLIVTAASEIEKKCKKKDLGYGEVVEEAFLIGPKCLQKMAKGSRFAMNVIIISLQLGCCCVYVVFVADNLKEVINEEFHLNWSNKVFMVMLAPVLVLLCLIRKISVLASVSVFGNVVFVVGFIIIMQYITHDAIPVNDLPWMVSPWDWPRGISTAVFAFEGICLVLPLRNKMRKPEDYLGFNGVLMTSMYLILVLYEALGFYGYLRYGSSVHASISLDLPHEPLYITLKILFPLVVLASYAIQFFVVVEIVYNDWLQEYVSKKGRSVLCFEYVFRVVMVILTVLVALVIPMLGTLIQFVGAFLGITISVTVPNIVELLLRHSDNRFGPLRWRFYFHLLLTLLGVAVTVTGTYTTIDDIVQAYKHPSDLQFSAQDPSPTTT